MSTGFGVVWENVGTFQNAIDGIIERAAGASRTAVVEGAHLVEAAMKSKASGPTHKRVDQHWEPPEHIGGEGPDVRSGTLRRSIRVGDIAQVGATSFGASVGPTAIYGRRVELEFGYPYASPGLREASPELQTVFERAWAAAVRS